MDVQEVRKPNDAIPQASVRQCAHPRGAATEKDDSAEVYIGEEFVGVLFVDDEDNERSYNFQMAILATDLG